MAMVEQLWRRSNLVIGEDRRSSPTRTRGRELEREIFRRCRCSNTHFIVNELLSEIAILRFYDNVQTCYERATNEVVRSRKNTRYFNTL
jgi:hypothetical protein